MQVKVAAVLAVTLNDGAPYCCRVMQAVATDAEPRVQAPFEQLNSARHGIRVVNAMVVKSVPIYCPSLDPQLMSVTANRDRFRSNHDYTG